MSHGLIIGRARSGRMRRLPQIASFATVAGRNGSPQPLSAECWIRWAPVLFAATADACQAPVDRGESCLGAIVDAQLGIDTLDMVACRLLGDEQLGGDLAVRPALRDESQDLDLPGGESRRPGCSPRCAMPGCRQNGVNRLGAEASGM